MTSLYTDLRTGIRARAAIKFFRKFSVVQPRLFDSCLVSADSNGKSQKDLHPEISTPRFTDSHPVGTRSPGSVRWSGCLAMLLSHMGRRCSTGLEGHGGTSSFRRTFTRHLSLARPDHWILTLNSTWNIFQFQRPFIWNKATAFDRSRWIHSLKFQSLSPGSEQFTWHVLS